MAMTRLPKDFVDFLKLLNSRRVKYLLIGGYAVGYHGYPRATADMDIWIAIDEENALRAISVIKEFGFNDPGLQLETFTIQKKIVRMGNPPIRIEVLSEIDGVDFQKCFKQKIIDRVGSVMINIIDLESLKSNKKASGRMKDLADLENLP